MKWYIFNKDHEPLTLDGKAIQFKSMESAMAFYETVKQIVPEPELDYFSGGKIESVILFYDGGYVAFDDLTKEQLDEDIEEGFYDEYLEEIKSMDKEFLSY